MWLEFGSYLAKLSCEAKVVILIDFFHLVKRSYGRSGGTRVLIVSAKVIGGADTFQNRLKRQHSKAGIKMNSLPGRGAL